MEIPQIKLRSVVFIKLPKPRRQTYASLGVNRDTGQLKVKLAIYGYLRGYVLDVCEMCLNISVIWHAELQPL